MVDVVPTTPNRTTDLFCWAPAMPAGPAATRAISSSAIPTLTLTVLAMTPPSGPDRTRRPLSLVPDRGLRFRRGLNGLDDLLVAGAPAQVSVEVRGDLLRGRLGVVFEQGFGDHDHAGRAKPALQCARVHERLLNRMQSPVLEQAFARLHGPAVDLHGEVGAGAHGKAVDEYGTGAAHLDVARALGRGQTKVVSQEVQQHPVGGDLRANPPPVHPALDGDGLPGPCGLIPRHRSSPRGGGPGPLRSLASSTPSRDAACSLRTRTGRQRDGTRGPPRPPLRGAPCQTRGRPAGRPRGWPPPSRRGRASAPRSPRRCAPQPRWSGLRSRPGPYRRPRLDVRRRQTCDRPPPCHPP